MWLIRGSECAVSNRCPTWADEGVPHATLGRFRSRVDHVLVHNRRRLHRGITASTSGNTGHQSNRDRDGRGHPHSNALPDFDCFTNSHPGPNGDALLPDRHALSNAHPSTNGDAYAASAESYANPSLYRHADPDSDPDCYPYSNPSGKH